MGTRYYDRGEKPIPGNGNLVRHEYIEMWVGNALVSAAHWCTRLGFEPFAYQGLETGCRATACHAVKQGEIIILFRSAMWPGNKEMGAFLEKHGDASRDFAFEVDNLDKCLEGARLNGAKVVRPIWEESDNFGKVRMATIQTFGDLVHTLIEKINYKGFFLPNFTKPLHNINRSLADKLPPIGLGYIDHLVGDQPENDMKDAAEWYINNLKFHRYWTVNDEQVKARFGGIHSTVLANHPEEIKVVVNEPGFLGGTEGKANCQTREFVAHNGGAGIQHIAFHTNDIITSTRNSRLRGQEFLRIPSYYYDELREKLKHAKIQVSEDMDQIQAENILIDYDDEGYLLQIFTKPMQDRPTYYTEIIQRRNHWGFGAGNFNSVFAAIEREQEARGNLHSFRQK